MCGERIGLIYLLTDLDEIYARFSGYAIGALLLLGGFTVFTYLLSSRLQKVISAPIRRTRQPAFSSSCATSSRS